MNPDLRETTPSVGRAGARAVCSKAQACGADASLREADAPLRIRRALSASRSLTLWRFAAGIMPVSPAQVELETRTLEEVDLALEILSSGQAPHVSRCAATWVAHIWQGTRVCVCVCVCVCVGRLHVGGFACVRACARKGIWCWQSFLKGVIRKPSQFAPRLHSQRLESVRAIAEAGVDFVSVGALTHSVTALDISLNIVTEAR